MQCVKSSAACDEARLANAVEAELPRFYEAGVKEEVASIVDLSLLLARLGRTERALQAVQKYTVPSEEVERWSDETLRFAARHQARRSNANWALKTAARIPGPLSRADALFSVARLYFRKGDKAAASKIVHLAAPLVAQSKNSKVLAYSAWMLARSGDDSGARRFFLKARQVPTDDMGQTLENKTRDIAVYQAKAGFYDEAAATAGKEENTIGSVVRALEEAQQFERALKIAERLSLEYQCVLVEQETLFRAMKAGKRVVVAKHLATLHNRYTKLASTEQSVGDTGIFALLYAFIGEKEKAKSLPAQPEVASTLYLNLMYFPKVQLQLPLRDLRDYLDKVGQDAPQTLQPRESVEVMLSIADLRKSQNLKNEAIQILRIADGAARQKIAADHGFYDSNELLHIASLWQQAGCIAETRAALSCVSKTATKDNGFAIAFLMAQHEFWPESLRLLQSYAAYDSLYSYSRFAHMQTQKNGGDPLLWITKLKSAANRAAALAGAAEGCEPQTGEERELVLSENGYSSQG